MKLTIMRYTFVFLSIAAIWAAVLILGTTVISHRNTDLYLVALFMTIVLFFIGFWRK